MTPARWQRTWPIFVAILAVVGATGVVIQCKVGPFPIALPAATMTFGIVVSGFVATQRNMLLTMSGTEVLRFAVRTGYHQDVIAYLVDCIRAGLLVTAISLAGLFIGTNTLLWAIWLSAMSGGVVLVICLMIRNEALVTRMIHRFLEENNSPAQQNTSGN